ncbi:MAG: hypothetical protein AAGF11_14415 [Myxococcota bacterium]
MRIAAALAGALTVPAPANAPAITPSPGAPRVELHWIAAPGCPSSRAVTKQLHALLGATAQPTDTARAVGRLRKSLGTYRLHLEIESAGRREIRQLQAVDCTLLARAGVLVIAVTVDALKTEANTTRRPASPAPNDVAGPPVPTPPRPEPRAITPPPEPPPEPPPDGPAHAPSPHAPRVPADDTAAVVDRPEPASGSSSATSTPNSARPWAHGVTVGVGAGGATGMVPGLTAGLEGRLEWRIGPVLLTAAGYHWLARPRRLEPEVGIESALSGGHLGAGVVLGSARLEVPLSAGVELAAMHGRGVGAQVQPNEARDLWVGLAIGTALRGWLSPRFALYAHLTGTLSIRRPAMQLSFDGEARETFRLPPVGARLVVGPLFRIF